MSRGTLIESHRLAEENAARVAVVAAMSATTMLFASLVSAYLVRRSFEDWRPQVALWPFVLLALGLAASAGIELAVRGQGTSRLAGLRTLSVASGLYLLGVAVVVGSIASSPGGVSRPHDAFTVLLLGVHGVHAILGTLFSVRLLREEDGPQNRLALARLVTHFLSALLIGILFVLFVLQ